MPVQTKSQFQPQSEQRFYHNHAHTVNRDGKNGAGDVMHDGIYHIWIEDTSTNSAINGMPNGIYFTKMHIYEIKEVRKIMINK